MQKLNIINYFYYHKIVKHFWYILDQFFINLIFKLSGVMMHQNIKWFAIILSIFFLTSTTLAQSTSLKKVMDQAAKDYQAGNYSSAVDGLEKAIDIVKNKQKNVYSKLLPQTLPGWTRGELTFSEADPRGIEKGYFIEQRYNKSDGYIKAILIIQSPMVSEAKKMFSSGNTMSNREGFSFETIANKKALVRYYDKQNKGEITILASNSSIASIYGNNVSLREMKNYARLFKYSEISKVK